MIYKLIGFWQKTFQHSKVNDKKMESEEFLEKAAKLKTKHNYEHQIYIDVQRSLFSLDYFENLPNEEM